MNQSRPESGELAGIAIAFFAGAFVGLAFPALYFWSVGGVFSPAADAWWVGYAFWFGFQGGGSCYGGEFHQWMVPVGFLSNSLAYGVIFALLHTTVSNFTNPENDSNQ